MPELPEVETVTRTLRAAILGSRIVKVQFASARIAKQNPRNWRQALVGAAIKSITRRGKYIVFALSSGGYLVVHLRMTGRFRLYPSTARPSKYDRLVMEVEGGLLDTRSRLTLVDIRQFARADYIESGTSNRHSGIAKLGPEADTMSEIELRRALARSHRPIKSLLLDQSALAGLGNIYADESLHIAGIHPLTPSDLVDRGQVRRLRAAIRRLLAAAIEACGTTFDTFSDLSGEAGGFAPYLNVYSRTAMPCNTCGTTIERLVISGRSTHFCPKCQPVHF